MVSPLRLLSRLRKRRSSEAPVDEKFFYQAIIRITVTHRVAPMRSGTTVEISPLHQLRAKRTRFMNLRIKSLTPKVWPAFEGLFGKKGACNGCWCMNWRIGREYCRRSPEANKADFKEIVKRGPAPGLLAFE